MSIDKLAKYFKNYMISDTWYTNNADDSRRFYEAVFHAFADHKKIISSLTASQTLYYLYHMSSSKIDRETVEIVIKRRSQSVEDITEYLWFISRNKNGQILDISTRGIV